MPTKNISDKLKVLYLNYNFNVKLLPLKLNILKKQIVIIIEAYSF